MGECERMWGSKGSASWKVTVSSRRGVLYPIRVTLSCASLFRFSTPTYVTVTLLFLNPFYRFLTVPTIWPLHSARPSSPFFFFLPMRIRSLRGRGGSLPIRFSLPRSCAALSFSCPAYPPHPLHFSLALPPCFSTQGHPYLVLRMNVFNDTILPVKRP